MQTNTNGKSGKGPKKASVMAKGLAKMINGLSMDTLRKYLHPGGDFDEIMVTHPAVVAIPLARNRMRLFSSQFNQEWTMDTTIGNEDNVMVISRFSKEEVDALIRDILSLVGHVSNERYNDLMKTLCVYLGVGIDDKNGLFQILCSSPNVRFCVTNINEGTENAIPLAYGCVFEM